jgi:PTS system N-acetylglucosamine-specific IIC component
VVASSSRSRARKTLLTVPPEVTAGFAERRRRWPRCVEGQGARQAERAAGILSGLSAGWLYNRYANHPLPDYLAFFGGRRFVPIARAVPG